MWMFTLFIMMINFSFWPIWNNSYPFLLTQNYLIVPEKKISFLFFSMEQHYPHLLRKYKYWHPNYLPFSKILICPLFTAILTTVSIKYSEAPSFNHTLLILLVLHTGLNRTVWDHMGPYSVVWGRPGLYRTVRDHTGPYRTIRNHMGPYWTIRDHPKPYGTIPDHMGPYRTIWDHTGPYGTIRYHMGPYMTIRDHTRPYRTKSVARKHWDKNIVFKKTWRVGQI